MPAKQTYRISEILDTATYPALVIAPTVIVDQPRLEDFACIAVFNNYGSNKKISITEIKTNYMTAQGKDVATFAVGLTRIERVSAMSGGADITPAKMSESADDLPAQVIIKANPTAVTLTSTMRRFTVGSEFNITRVLACQVADWHGAGDLCNALKYAPGRGDSGVQRFFMDEGEGVLLYLPQATYPLSQTRQINIILRNPSTNATYQIEWTDKLSGEENQVGIFNGSGSSIDLEIVSIRVYEIGTDELPVFYIERFSGEPIGGSSITPISYRTANDLLDSNIITKTDTRCKRAGNNIGAIVIEPTYRRNIKVALGDGPEVPGVLLVDESKFNKPIDFSTINGNEIELREGEGLAIYKRTGSALGLYEYVIEFQLESTITGTYPAEGDVDDGVDYGPTGADYEGTLVQPAEADVKLGVDYGADGTEFEGSYSPGGSTTYSRSRVVNQQ
jgi:hypothetical protein